MDVDDPSGDLWRQERARRPPFAQEAEALGRLVDEDHDDAETSYYEFFADPDVQALDNAQRSYAGQYLRRLRRRREQERHRDETRRRGARRRRLR